MRCCITIYTTAITASTVINNSRILDSKLTIIAHIYSSAHSCFIAKECAAGNHKTLSTIQHRSAIIVCVASGNISAGNLNDTVSVFIHCLWCAFQRNRSSQPVIQCYVMCTTCVAVDD